MTVHSKVITNSPLMHNLAENTKSQFWIDEETGAVQSISTNDPFRRELNTYDQHLNESKAHRFYSFMFLTWNRSKLFGSFVLTACSID